MIIIQQKLREADERYGERVRSKRSAVVRLVGIHEDNEFRVVCRKISEERMEVAVIVITAAEFARTCKLCCSRFRSDRILGDSDRSAKERLVDDGNKHASYLIRAFLFQYLFLRILRDFLYSSGFIPYLIGNMRSYRHAPVRKCRQCRAHINRRNRKTLPE